MKQVNFKKRYISLVTAGVLFGLSGGATLNATDSFITENVATGKEGSYFLTYTDKNGVVKGIKLKNRNDNFSSTTGTSAIKDIIPQSNTAHGWSIEKGTPAEGTPSFTYEGATYIVTSSEPTLSGWEVFDKSTDRINTLTKDNAVSKTFVGIVSEDHGGAISNNKTGGHDITADFIGNNASSYFAQHGGAIYNKREAKIGNITGDFIGNSTIATGDISEGGAIYNGAKGAVGNITGDFIGNVARGDGGAIQNDGGTIGDITGDFIGNSSNQFSGGAIVNDYNEMYGIEGTIGNITGDFIGNTSFDKGGAIYNRHKGKIGDIIGSFIGNSSGNNGGAIYNAAAIGNITGNFIGNSITNIGGAIYNYGTIESITGDFIENSTGTYGYGGAIYNTGTVTLLNSSFLGNKAGRSGGAIYIGGTVNLATTTAGGKDSIFSGNTQGTGASKVSNAIHMRKLDTTPTLNLFASSSEVGKGRVVFNDSITSHDENATININNTVPTALSGVGNTGTVVINADMSGYKGVTNFYNGTIQVGQGAGVNTTTGYTKFFGGSFNVLGANATLSTQNRKIDKIDNSTWTTTAGNTLNIALDIDATAKTNDYFDNKISTGQHINISSINVFNPTNLTNTSFKVTNNGTNWTLADGAKQLEVNTPVYIYSYKVDDSKLATNGEIILGGTDKLPTPDPDGGGSGGIVGVNPGAVASRVASSSSMANMIAVSNNIFNRVERISRTEAINRVSYIDRAINPENYVASINEEIPLNLDDVRFSSNVQNSVWAQTFGSFDEIKLSSRKIDVDTYGALFGFDSKDYSYKKFDMSYTAYLGLSNSDSKYNSMKVDQLSTFVGAGVSFYKNNFTLKTLLTVGYLDNEITNSDTSNVFYSNEKFNNITASFGAKASYNYKIENNYIIQPNLALKYMYVSSNDYTNSANVKVDTDSLNAFQAVPAVKFVYVSDDDTLEVYTQVGYSFLGNTEVDSVVSGIALRGEKLDDYAEINFGLSQDVNDFRFYGKLSATAGGMDGIGAQAGLEWKF